jgi:hypothetical protein
MPLPVAGYGLVVKMKTAADIEAEAERMVNRLYEQQGGDKIEVALQVLLVANLWLIEQAETILSGILQCDRKEVRDRRGYMRDIVSSDGHLRSILNGALNAVRKQDKRLCVFVREHGDKYADKNFSALCADSADEYQSIIKPLTDALQRYCLYRQTSRGKMADDPIMAADAVSIFTYSDLILQMYVYLAKDIFPIIDKIEDYRVLNGRAVRDAILKVLASLPLSGVEAIDIIKGKDGNQLLQDIFRVTFSIECMDRLFAARGTKTQHRGKISLIEEFDGDTMSLNYYHQHYNAAWRDVEFKRKKKR